jgi:hypothetical protein
MRHRHLLNVFLLLFANCSRVTILNMRNIFGGITEEIRCLGHCLFPNYFFFDTIYDILKYFDGHVLSFFFQNFLIFQYSTSSTSQIFSIGLRSEEWKSVYLFFFEESLVINFWNNKRKIFALHNANITSNNSFIDRCCNNQRVWNILLPTHFLCSMYTCQNSVRSYQTK